MTKDDTNKDDIKIKEWMYDFAWKLREVTQEANDRLDSKATNIINFSSLLIPIITGILLLYFGKDVLNPTFRCLWFISLILLLLSIFFAFKVIWLKDQGLIIIFDHFNKCKEDKISTILENTAYDLGTWQNKILDAKKDKIFYFIISSYAFIIALTTITISLPFFLL